MDEDARSIYALFRNGQADETLLALARLEERRTLLPSELVLKGRCIQLGSGSVIEDYREAEKAFRAALERDEYYVPALLELGWFHYAPEDDARTALPFFEQALDVSLAHLKEAIKGKVGCLEELESAEVAADFIRQITQDALKIDDFKEEELEEEQENRD
jgi:tetratricopeptide (TPR) repeat protein